MSVRAVVSQWDPEPLQVEAERERSDRFHDECGVFGVFGEGEAANLTYLGLHSQQHRGQESAGIVTGERGQLFVHRGLGLVQDVFTEPVLKRLPGDRAIGHVRYSTAGGSLMKNAQPFAVDYAHGSLAVCHNGNLTNGQELRAELEDDGSIFSSASDTEVVIHLIARSKEGTTVDRIVEALGRVQGAYSMLFLSPEELIAVRDPHGFRPLCIGALGDRYLIASEPVAFQLIGAEYVRDVEPGEMVVLSASGMRTLRPFDPQPRRMCIFEYVYFARPDAHLGGVSVYEARKALGRVLAEQAPAPADIVIPVPDSGVPAALGFSKHTGLPYEMGLIRSHYVGRTFIEPQQSIRHFGVRLKLHPVGSLLAGKRVAVIDDSIVRGTTSRKIVRMIRDAGAKEVHVRISSPPVRWPCFYGIDTPTRQELVAAQHDADEIARYITADSLGYVSVEGLHQAVGGSGYCDACFSGDYPVPVPLEQDASRRGRRPLPLVGV
jgi:amidophosphoribosyltransferase